MYIKDESDHLKKIEVWWLKRHGYMQGYKRGSVEWTHSGSQKKSSITVTGNMNDIHPNIQLEYRILNEFGEYDEEIDYKIPLVTTPCNFGGERYWFICPGNVSGTPCQKRVGVLYMLGKYFLCRHCHNLTYKSRNMNRRYKHFTLFRVMNLDVKMTNIRESMKTPFYAGKPTKKMKKLMELQDEISNIGPLPDVQDLL